MSHESEAVQGNSVMSSRSGLQCFQRNNAMWNVYHTDYVLRIMALHVWGGSCQGSV